MPAAPNFYRSKLTLLICSSLAFSPTSAFSRSASLTPEAVLQEAARYTVKVDVQTTTGLNADERGVFFGTGFLIDRERGWLITNAHVATRSPGKITVTFKNGEPIKATRVHVDTFMDMAVLSVPTKDIPASASAAKLDCSALPNEGASVFAYGHPWGLDYTASRGIISGHSWFSPQKLVQTDATINQGNSGGPLIRVSDGAVVGVSSANYKAKNDDNASAVGLAQPVPPICHTLSLLRQGLDPSTRLLPVDIATGKDGIEPTVAGISDEDSGFMPGDRIVSINGSAPVRSYPLLIDLLRGALEPVKVHVIRGDSKIEVVSPLRVVSSPLLDRSINISGLVLSQPWRVDNAEIDPAGNLVVVDIDTESDLGLSDVRATNRLKYVNGRSFRTTADLYNYVSGLPDDTPLEMIFWTIPDYEEFSGGYFVARVNKSKLEWVVPSDQ